MTDLERLCERLDEPRRGIHENGEEEMKSWDELWQQCREASSALRQSEQKLREAEKECDQQERFKWEANKRADAAESNARDAERLDWLLHVMKARNVQTVYYERTHEIDGPTCVLQDRETGHVLGYDSTARAAIDAARREGDEHG